MKRSFLTFILTAFTFIVTAQDISISNDKMNVFYKGIDNPISFAATGVTNTSLIIKATNGSISKEYGYYTFHSDSVGQANIILYKEVKGQLVEIGRNIFRVKAIPAPIAKVGPSAGGHIVTAVLKAQQFIRAEIENFDFDIRIIIDSFKICITRGDSCFYKEVQNYGNKFNEVVINTMSEIKKGDTVIFKDIFAKNIYGELKELNPIVFFCQ